MKDTEKRWKDSQMAVGQKVCNATILVLGAMVFALIAIEWMAGCGEVTHYANGTWKTNQCVFYDRPIKTGRWQ